MSKTKQQPKSVQPTPQVQDKLRNLLAQAQQAQQMFQVYAEGVMNGLALEGDWQLDANTMIFTRQDKPKQENPEE